MRERQARRRANAVRGTNVDAAELKLSVQNHGGDEIPLPQMRSASRMPEGCGSFPLFVHDAREMCIVYARAFSAISAVFSSAAGVTALYGTLCLSKKSRSAPVLTAKLMFSGWFP